VRVSSCPDSRCNYSREVAAMVRKAVRGVELTEAQGREVDELLRRRNVPPRGRERLEMVKAVSVGYDLAQIKGWSGREARTIRRWVRAYAKKGLAGLTDAARGGDRRRPTRPTLRR
jgi:hypothetical protein